MKRITVLFIAMFVMLASVVTPVQAETTNQVVYFKEKTCLVCAGLAGWESGVGSTYVENDDYLKKMEDQGITVITYDLMSDDFIDAYEYTDEDGNVVQVTAVDVFRAFNNRYGRKADGVPVVFAGDKYFEDDEIKTAVDSGEMLTLSAQDMLDVDVEKGGAYQDLTGIVGFFAVLGAGLLDGFNPCAIALLLLFISLLGFTENKRTLILVSTVYIFALFISYFLIGTFFLSVLERFASTITIVGTIINWFVAVLCTFLFLFNLYDFIQARNENYGNIKNQLPKWLMRFNKKIVKQFTKVINNEEDNKGLLAVLGITFLLGITLSVTELVCTGQIYFGILYGIHTLDSTYAYLLLIAYNIMFVIPLIVIAVISVRVRSVMSVSNWVREHMTHIKFANAMLFLGIAIYYYFRLF